MTFADATIDALGLHGPPGLTHIVATSRFYTFRYLQIIQVPKTFLIDSRPSIDMQTNEIPWTTPTGPIPPPCFSDTNITVYAIPTLPSPSQPLTISSLPEKRKREPSPVSPRKRLNPGSLAPGRMILSDDLLSQVRKRDFDPITLSGSVADEYRNMIIKAMFPNTQPNANLDPATRQEQRRRSKAGMRAKALGLTSPCVPRNDPWTPSIRKNAASSGGR
jgi:hypothetical protein